MSDPRPLRPRTPALLLFLSGITALVYQTLWIKQLTLVVGVDVYAVTTGVAGFFAGLAAGSALFGRLADRTRSPLRVYARLELGIAVLGVLSTLALGAAASPFVALRSSVGPLAWLLPFALVALPAALMGGTLPPLLAAIHPDDGAVGRSSGRLYAANTAGAVLGALLTVFALVPLLGIRGAALAAAAINLALGAYAWTLASRTAAPAPPVARERAPLPKEARLAVSLYALAGGVAIGYEVVWSQVIVQFLSTRSIAFAVVLATYLFGLVVGSWLYSFVADRVTARWRAFGLLIAGAGVCALATFWMLGPWLPDAQDAIRSKVYALTGSRMLSMCARFALAAGVLVLPATLLLGAAFPAATRLIVEPEHPGRDVGLTLALNTLFGILGSVVAGFVLVPTVGLAGSLGVFAAVAALIGAVALARQSGFDRAACAKAAALPLAVGGMAILLPADRLVTLLVTTRSGTLLSYDEGPSGTVAVMEQTAPKGSFRRLYIQGVSNTGDAVPSLRYMRLQSLTPLIVHPGEPRSALIIGLGTGITSGATLAYPGLERRLCVELLKPVVDAVSLFEGNFDVGNDDDMEIRVADGRHELMRSDEAFDLITLEPPPPAAAGVVNLYSRDFYELARTRLAEGGLLAQWWPINTQNHEDSQSLVRSMLDVFPHVTLWTTEFHEMMLVGSIEPQTLDHATIAARMGEPSVAAALRDVGVETPADLLATWICDREGLEVYVEDALPVTDDRPRIEHARWVRPIEVTWVLPKLMAVRTPPPVDATDEEKARIEDAHRRLADFYEMTRLALGRDEEGWSRMMQAIMSDRRPNAYFDWFLP